MMPTSLCAAIRYMIIATTWATAATINIVEESPTTPRPIKLPPKMIEIVANQSVSFLPRVDPAFDNVLVFCTICSHLVGWRVREREKEKEKEKVRD